jgi:hypothetical protein
VSDLQFRQRIADLLEPKQKEAEAEAAGIQKKPPVRQKASTPLRQKASGTERAR